MKTPVIGGGASRDPDALKHFLTHLRKIQKFWKIRPDFHQKRQKMRYSEVPDSNGSWCIIMIMLVSTVQKHCGTNLIQHRNMILCTVAVQPDVVQMQ